MLSNLEQIARIIQGIMSLFLIAGVLVAFYSWKSKKNQDQRTAALSYSLTKNKEYFEARSAIETAFREYFKNSTPASAKQVSDIIRQEQEIATKLKYILAHWEIMAISIYDDLVDEKTCFEMVGTTLVNTVTVMKPYMEELRTNDLNKRRYDYLLILHNEWSTRIKDMERGGKISRYEQYVTSGNNIQTLLRKLQTDMKNW